MIQSYRLGCQLFRFSEPSSTFKTTRAALAFVVIENYAHGELVYYLCKVVTSDNSDVVSSPSGVGKMRMGRLDGEVA